MNKLTCVCLLCRPVAAMRSTQWRFVQLRKPTSFVSACCVLGVEYVCHFFIGFHGRAEIRDAVELGCPQKYFEQSSRSDENNVFHVHIELFASNHITTHGTRQQQIMDDLLII